MKKNFDVSAEVLKKINTGKSVEGSISLDPVTKTIVFKAYNRKAPKRRKDRVICYHENGWLKESENNLKFFTSIKKQVGAVRACQAMERDLENVTDELFQMMERGEYPSDILKL